MHYLEVEKNCVTSKKKKKDSNSAQWLVAEHFLNKAYEYLYCMRVLVFATLLIATQKQMHYCNCKTRENFMLDCSDV